MNLTSRTIASLGIVTFSILSAHAQSTSGATAESYVTRSALSGADVTLTAYWSSYTTTDYKQSYGQTTDYGYATSDATSFTYSQGASGASPASGGSFDSEQEDGGILFSLTNNSLTTGEWAYLYVDDTSETYASAEANGSGWAEASTDLYNYANGDDISQVSGSYALGSNEPDNPPAAGLDSVLPGSGGYGLYANKIIDSGSSSFYSSGYQYSPVPVGSAVNYSNSWVGYYVTYLNPGQSDELFSGEATWHDAYDATPNATPEPCTMILSIATVGLAFRRRSKKTQGTA
jgi:hypothetical protein